MCWVKRVIVSHSSFILSKIAIYFSHLEVKLVFFVFIMSMICDETVKSEITFTPSGVKGENRPIRFACTVRFDYKPKRIFVRPYTLYVLFNVK